VAKRRKADPPRARLIPKLAPDTQEARDEGPHLIPIEAETHISTTQVFNSRYLELADIALRDNTRKRK
jgi:hypothetical protein